MRIQRIDPETVSLGPLSAILLELLRQIVPSAQDDDAAVQARFFPSPSGGRERGLDADWKSYVEPDLRRLFQNSLEVIEQDIAPFSRDEIDHPEELRLPVTHLEAWVHGLNQARLALAARHRLTEPELEDDAETDDYARAFVLLQTDFYALLQQVFLHELGDLA